MLDRQFEDSDLIWHRSSRKLRTIFWQRPESLAPRRTRLVMDRLVTKDDHHGTANIRLLETVSSCKSPAVSPQRAARQAFRNPIARDPGEAAGAVRDPRPAQKREPWHPGVVSGSDHFGW